MGAVAESAVAAVFAAAEVDGSIFLCGVGLWGKAASLVGSIAERLGGTLAAGAPVVGLASLNLDGDGGLLGDDGFGHGVDLLGVVVGLEWISDGVRPGHAHGRGQSPRRSPHGPRGS